MLFRQGAAKAAKAYGKSIAVDLAKAIEALRARPQRLDRCMEALQMTTVPKALAVEADQGLERPGSPSDAMSLQSVRAFLAEHAPDIEILEADTSTATVALAAEAHGVATAQIAKTLSLRLGDEPILVVMSGDARLDNRKYKDRFGAKAKMLGAAEVLEATSHPVGGVCPFGLPGKLRVYADVSLRAFDVVVPAAGSAHSAMRIAPERLAQLAGAEWVDVAQG